MLSEESLLVLLSLPLLSLLLLLPRLLEPLLPLSLPLLLVSEDDPATSRSSHSMENWLHYGTQHT